MEKYNDDVDVLKIVGFFKTHKYIIGLTVFTASLFAYIYVATATPIYRGQLLIEVGDIVIKPQGSGTANILSVNKVADLQEKLSHFFVGEMQGETGVSFESLRGNTSLLKIIYQDGDKAKITKKLEQIAKFTLDHLDSKAAFYRNEHHSVWNSSVVGNVHVIDDPVSPNKLKTYLSSIFLGIILGLLLSILADSFRNKV